MEVKSRVIRQVTCEISAEEVMKFITKELQKRFDMISSGQVVNPDNITSNFGEKVGTKFWPSFEYTITTATKVEALGL